MRRQQQDAIQKEPSETDNEHVAETAWWLGVIGRRVKVYPHMFILIIFP